MQNTISIMTESTANQSEKTYYLYRTFSGKIFSSPEKYETAEKLSEYKQMAAEEPEVKQPS